MSIIDSEDFKTFQEKLISISKYSFGVYEIESFSVYEIVSILDTLLVDNDSNFNKDKIGKKYNILLSKYIKNSNVKSTRIILNKIAFFYDRKNKRFYQIPKHIKNETKPKKDVFSPFLRDSSDIPTNTQQYALKFYNGKKGYYDSREQAQQHVLSLIDNNNFDVVINYLPFYNDEKNNNNNNNNNNIDNAFGEVYLNQISFTLNIKFEDNCTLLSTDKQLRNLLVTLGKGWYPQHSYTKQVKDNEPRLKKYIDFHKKVIYKILISPQVKDILLEDQQIYFCKNNDCLGNRGFVSNITTLDVPCIYNCGTIFCHKCLGDYHGEIECASIDSESMKLMTDNKFRQCPRCRNMIEKSEGCSHISCTCGSHFCYDCGKEFDSSRSHTRENPCTITANNWWMDEHPFIREEDNIRNFNPDSDNDSD
jgi:hypothetical protein